MDYEGLSQVWMRVHANMSGDKDLRSEMIAAGYSDALHSALYKTIAEKRNDAPEDLSAALGTLHKFYQQRLARFDGEMKDWIDKRDEQDRKVVSLRNAVNDAAEDRKNALNQKISSNHHSIQGFKEVLSILDGVLKTPPAMEPSPSFG